MLTVLGQRRKNWMPRGNGLLFLSTWNTKVKNKRVVFKSHYIEPYRKTCVHPLLVKTDTLFSFFFDICRTKRCGRCCDRGTKTVGLADLGRWQIPSHHDRVNHSPNISLRRLPRWRLFGCVGLSWWGLRKVFEYVIFIERLLNYIY